ncbi:MAG: hypothetical protein GY696_21595 [Gammaproteobacteria bacterium]|nr:hypothetical protein [Gammaproteobacteria bacterium]
MRKIALSLLLLFLTLPAISGQNRLANEHKIYFKGSDYELNVYYIRGREDGQTLLLIGGIQGDEPGGYMSADLYPDLLLERGNLIIVPRANLKSIIRGERGSDGDMNRQFHDNASQSPMSQVVNQLKQLMGESDLFLHLHDGWGYHYPVYVDHLRNPSRYGQSIITDADDFLCDSGKTLDLGNMAKQVLQHVNARIKKEDHHLHYFNTHTADPETSHPSMRKTATFYALKKHCLPAFGVEASKNLPSLELKILHHNLVINEFMALMDIIPETPRVFVPHPRLDYVELELNDRIKILKDNETLAINAGDKLRVTRIHSNYDRGISCDLLGQGNLNDLGEPFNLKGSTRLVFRKEGEIFGHIHLRNQKDGSEKTDSHRIFMISINGKKQVHFSDEVISVNGSDRLKLISSFDDGSNSELPTLNFKGWVPAKGGGNSGDDRGYEIIPLKEQFIRKYSKHRKGRLYPVVAVNREGQQLGRIWIKLSDVQLAEE